MIRDADNRSQGTASPEKTFLGHPAGVFLVSGTEMWERFSYFGLGALLVLFLTAPVATGGFAWDKEDAVILYGLYSGLAFSLPAVGGWIASRYIGERRSIVIGGLTIILGHLLLGAPGFVPWLIEHTTQVPVEKIFVAAKIPLGALFLPAQDAAQLKIAALEHVPDLSGRQMTLLSVAYSSKGWGLFLGLGLIIIGTAFLKGPISSIVGKLYRDGDSRREAGYTIFMMGVWAGALLAEFVVGAIGEHISWHMGLAVAGIGMAAGLTNYLIRQEAVLGDVGKEADLKKHMVGADVSFSLSDTEKAGIRALCIMGLFTIVFSAAYNQYGGIWNLIIYNNVGRSVGGFVVPAAWFIAITTLGFIIFAPIINKFYHFLEQRGYTLDVVQKQALGLLAISIAYVILMVPASTHENNPEALLGAGWIVAAYVFFALGDVFIWPPQITAVSELAPKRYQAFMIGLWYVTYGLGGIIAGYIAPLAYSKGLPVFTGLILSVCLFGAVILMFLRPLLKRLINVAKG